MPYTYDNQNIFAKILRGEIPNETVLETDHSLAFNDIAPQAPIHILIVPKGAYVCHDHFAAEASDAEIVDFMRASAEVCRLARVSPGEGYPGFRVIGNSGEVAMQEVPHYHLHILGGRPLGGLLQRR